MVRWKAEDSRSGVNSTVDYSTAPYLNPNLAAIWYRLCCPDYPKPVHAETISLIAGNTQQRAAVGGGIDWEVAIRDPEYMP